jgi:superfamily II DNA/RNA helicase
METSLMKTFQELSLPKPIENALADMKFSIPTPIQAQAIPVALAGKDLIGCAQTGTGKTAAFGIPMIVSLLKNKDQNALILVPTRELANQVTEVLRDLSKYTVELRVVNIIGGMSMQPQLRALSKGFRIMVATPGRLVDHLQRQPNLLSKVSFLVLDEADRMLDMGFAPQLKQIYPKLAKDRQTALFSATLAPEINELANRMLKSPVKVQVGEVSKAAPKIDQQIRRMKQDEKNDILLDEINHREGTMLVFARTQRRVDRIARFLAGYGLSVTHIHGGRSQGQRTRAIEGFKNGDFRVMIATDIAARGIDIDHVAHVVNVDLPEVPEDYVHRIGRTARAGRSGQSISFISPDEQDNWKAIEKLLGKKFMEGAKAPKSTAEQKVLVPQAPVVRYQDPRAQQQQRRTRTERPANNDRQRREFSSAKPFQPSADRGQPIRAKNEFQADRSQPIASNEAKTSSAFMVRASVPKNIRFKERF